MAIETSSVVGPLFWYEVDHDDDGKAFLQIIFRKSDVRKKGKTRGWELILSHDFSTGITSGFCKGTPSSDIVSGVEQLRKCASDIEHAMLLPLIIIGHESSAKTDQKQRDVRDWLRRLENAISLRAAGDSEHFDGYHSEKFGIDLDSINRDLVECQAQVLWKSPVAFISIIRSMEDAARLFMETVPEERKSPNMRRFQKRMISRLHLYGAKWAGIETFANTTMQRLEIQRSAEGMSKLYNIIAQKDSKVNLQMASDQKMLAHLSRQDSEAMKGISILGAIFLPGTFLASIFSTTFFDFNDAPDMASVVSPRFWIFWAVTVPFTLIVVGLYFYWERRRAASNEQGEANLYQDIQALEASIMETMRKRTMVKANTWTERISRKEAMAADNDNDYGAFRLPTVPVSSNYLEVPPANV
ncbi:hypothetical protein CPLU01_12234 [Colletotrichum plurivorum]|uniref:CorA-like Mg2+ transporter n=1 Tax=Colletotrichum plurivorum TaxID=2175906 RepID=A0A8H6JYZ4_9PEZI|nr:hypothetical protein CPLU01_12234 [Colletotrichum plurivorum]